MRKRFENPKPNELVAELAAAGTLLVGLADEEPSAGTLAEAGNDEAVAVEPFKRTVEAVVEAEVGVSEPVGKAPKAFVARLPVGVRLPNDEPLVEEPVKEPKGLVGVDETEPNGLLEEDPVPNGSLDADPVTEGLVEEPNGSETVAVGPVAEPVPGGAVT